MSRRGKGRTRLSSLKRVSQLPVNVHAWMGVRGRTLDGDEVDMLFECLPINFVVAVVTETRVTEVLLSVSGHIDPGEFLNMFSCRALEEGHARQSIRLKAVAP